MKRLILLACAPCVACPDSPAPLGPAVQILAPADGSTVTAGQGVELQALVSDPDDVPERLALAWSADGQEICPAAPPRPDGHGDCLWVAQSGGGAVQATVVDPGGRSASAALTLVVVEPNAAPTCVLHEPADGTTLGPADTVLLRGTVSDDGDSLTVAISSDLDGPLAEPTPDAEGDVEALLGPLSLGAHVLTLAASDPQGLACSASVGVEVLPVDTGPGDSDTGP